MAPVLPDAPVSALRQVYVVPEMVLPRLCADVLLLIREDVVDEGCASSVSTRPRADLAARRLECFLEEVCDDCDIVMGCWPGLSLSSTAITMGLLTKLGLLQGVLCHQHFRLAVCFVSRVSCQHIMKET